MNKRLMSKSLILAAGLFLFGMVSGCKSARTPVVQTIEPGVLQSGDASVSFWKERVTYPFEVKYKKARDKRGVQWEIAYMDEYAGELLDPQVVVLIHGKGVFGGYFGHVMKVALESGLRVIVPDLPHCGKSIPGNIKRGMARTLEDTREVIHDLVVDQLGVKKAAYLGHSLGGQWVLGYALNYPENVTKIILEAPLGLEEFPTSIANAPFFDPFYMRDMEVWSKLWGEYLTNELGRSEDYIRNFYYFKQRNRKTGEVENISTGYFLKNNDYTRFVTDVRVEMIKGNSWEFNTYCTTHIRDIYAMGVEVRKEDPGSIVKHLGRLDIPVFLAFGEEDPFVPVTVLSGNKDLKWDVIRPFYNTLNSNNNPPVVKLYPGCGHFIHTDAPDLFSKDMVDFVKNQNMVGPLENVASYKAPWINVPDDVEAFFSGFRRALLTADMAEIAEFYSEKFLENGNRKSEFLVALGSIVNLVKDYKVLIEIFETDRSSPNIVRISGTVDLGIITVPFKKGSMIIKEKDGWKWYGNQK